MRLPETFTSWTRQYEIRTQNKGSDEDRPRTSSSDTPSTYRPNPHFERSKVVTAVGYNKFTGRQFDKIFGLKIIPYGQHKFLENEVAALRRIPNSGISQEYVEAFVSKNGFYVLAFEWLTSDGAEAWKSISEIINQYRKPLSEFWTIKENEKFITSFVKCVHNLHKFGIVHGDIKDSHVFVNLNNTGDVKLIDFGLSQFKNRRALWKGGSHGFSPPQYWKAYEKPRPLTWKDLLKIDNYCLASTLYYAYSMQVYPLANPNISEILDDPNMVADPGFKDYERDVTKFFREDSLEFSTNRGIRFLLRQGLDSDYRKITLNTIDMLSRQLMPSVEENPLKRLLQEFFGRR